MRQPIRDDREGKRSTVLKILYLVRKCLNDTSLADKMILSDLDGFVQHCRRN